MKCNMYDMYMVGGCIVNKMIKERKRKRENFVIIVYICNIMSYKNTKYQYYQQITKKNF